MRNVCWKMFTEKSLLPMYYWSPIWTVLGCFPNQTPCNLPSVCLLDRNFRDCTCSCVVLRMIPWPGGSAVHSWRQLAGCCSADSWQLAQLARSSPVGAGRAQREETAVEWEGREWEEMRVRGEKRIFLRLRGGWFVIEREERVWIEWLGGWWGFQCNSGRRSAVRSYLCLTDQRGGERGGGIRATSNSSELRPIHLTGRGWKAKASEGENVATFNSPSHPVEELLASYIVCQVEWSMLSWTAVREWEKVQLLWEGERVHCLGKAGSLGEEEGQCRPA